MKILISGEGPTDCGKSEYGTANWIEGPVQILIRKIIGEEIEIVNIDKREIFKSRRSKKESKLHFEGHEKKAYYLCVKANQIGADCVMCYVDTDFERLRGNKEDSIRKKFHLVYNQIQSGFEKYGKKEAIPVVPATMIESWLLGDASAFNSVFNRMPNNPNIPREPEYIWGDKCDPMSDYPKNRLQRVLRQFNSEGSREVFNDLADEINIDNLRRSCSLSFNKFYGDIERIVSS